MILSFKCDVYSHFRVHIFVRNGSTSYFVLKKSWTKAGMTDQARMSLQLQLQHWGAGNVYLLVLSSWKVNIAENPIVVMGL